MKRRISVLVLTVMEVPVTTDLEEDSYQVKML